MTIRPSQPLTDPKRADALIRVVHPDLAAQRLGLTVEQVLARRVALGLPLVAEQFAKPRRGKSRPNYYDD
jgi:hypothetical protein